MSGYTFFCLGTCILMVYGRLRLVNDGSDGGEPNDGGREGNQLML